MDNTGDRLPITKQDIQSNVRTWEDIANLPFKPETMADLSVETQARHKQALETVVEFAEQPELQPVLHQYSETLRLADFDETITFLSNVEGSEEIAKVAREQFIAQADNLLLGVKDIFTKNSARIFTYGYDVTFNSIQDIQLVLSEMTTDIQLINELVSQLNQEGGDATNLHAKVLSKLDKYMFEGRVFAQEERGYGSIVVLSGDMPFIRQLGERGVLLVNEDRIPEPDKRSEGDKQIWYAKSDDKGIVEGLHAVSSDYLTGENVFSSEELSQVVVIDLDMLGPYWNHNLRNLYENWQNIPPNKRPLVILLQKNQHRYPNLSDKWMLSGFLFCEGLDEFYDVLKLAGQFSNNQKNEMYAPRNLEAGQREAYDNSELREWENETARADEPLRRIFKLVCERDVIYEFDLAVQQAYRDGKQIFSQRKFFNDLACSPEDSSFKLAYQKYLRHLNAYGEQHSELPADIISELLEFYNTSPFVTERINNVLDLGTGEGRISGMIARAGLNVVGLDISKEQLERVGERIWREGEGLRGEKEHKGLSYEALQKLESDGLLPRDNLRDDEETRRNLLTIEGSFFELEEVLDGMVREWSDRFPGVDMAEFFDVGDRSYLPDFSREGKSYIRKGFNIVLWNWNTFCEVGSPENQKMVLDQVWNVVDRGGSLVIEIPDRMVEPYASALKAYHDQYPDEPYGTIRDKKPEGFDALKGEDRYPPRYFPDINELILLLKSVGFEVGMEDVQTYLVEKDGEAGRKMTLKEYFIVAQKPWQY